jgi:speckle-type POZ protein
MNPILINDIKPEVFRHLIWYVYGGGLVADHFITSAKDLIDAADKYGVINLKLEAEVWYVHSTTITVDNVIDHLLYADAKNCALLKEAVMDFIVHNKKEVLQKVSFKDVPGDMYKDLLVAVSRYYGDDNYNDEGEEGQDDEDIDTMRISTLRRKLVSFGLDIDCSRDALISALKEFYSD